MAILAAIVLLSIVGTIHLLYVRFNKSKLEKVKNMHKNSKYFELYKVIYSKKTLILSGYLSSILLSNFIVQIFKSFNQDRSAGATFLILALTLLPMTLLIYWFRIDKSRK